MYIIYKTTHISSQKYYIGVHKVIPNDSYLGSGIILQKMLKKYNRKEFIRETLFEFVEHTEAFTKEKELLSIYKNDALCINLAEGGKGGPNFKGKIHSNLTKLILSEKSKNQVKHKKSNEVKSIERQTRIKKNNGNWHSIETIEKITEKAKNRTPDTNKKVSNTINELYKLDENGNNTQRNKISNSMKNYYSNPEARLKHSNIMKNSKNNNSNKMWINNPELQACKMIPKDGIISEGWVKGRKIFK